MMFTGISYLFFFFKASLDEARRLKVLEWEKGHSPRWNKAMVKSFLLESMPFLLRMLWAYFTMVTDKDRMFVSLKIHTVFDLPLFFFFLCSFVS